MYWEHTTGGEVGYCARLAALLLDAEEASQWWRLGFGDDSQDQCSAEQILQINDAVDCAGSLDPPV